MANESLPNTNQSQFFMTLDACPWLDKKHTIFGRIEGPTLYNLVKISELETGSEDRPHCDPMPKIVRTEVVTNPFEDIVPRNLSNFDKFQQEDEQTSAFKAPAAKKVSGPKDTNLLSFADDEDQDGAGGTTKVNRFAARKKIVSSHDALAHQDPTLSKETAVNKEVIEESRLRKENTERARETLKSRVGK